MMDWYGGGTAGWIVMSLSMVAFWGIAIGLVVWLVRSIGSDRREEHMVLTQPFVPVVSHDGAADVLKRRYASGEIERNEYQQKLKDLS
jgi:putative membrane protein